MHHVVDGDDSEQPAIDVDNRRRHQAVLAEQEAHFLLIHVIRDQMQLFELELGQQHAAPAAHDLAERDRADRLEARVDDIDVVELVGQVRLGAQVVDGLADRPEFRRRDQLTLHQATGAVLGIGQTLLDRRALGHGQGLQDRDLLALIEVAQDLDGIVGVELGDRGAGFFRGQLLEHLLSHRLVEIGEQLGVQLWLELGDQRRALVIAELLEQIRLVGGMERGDQLEGPLDLTGAQRFVDDANKLLRQNCRRSAVRLATLLRAQLGQGRIIHARPARPRRRAPTD